MGKIILKNPYTAPVGVPSARVSVEPWYESTLPILTRCNELTDYERLEVVRQFAQGVCALHQNCICGDQIIAHRDLKLSNGVIEKGENSFKIRLIDMASVRLQAEPSPTGTIAADGNTATVTPMSTDNTGPELVNARGCKVCRTTDVYALGMMLASFFFMHGITHKNPNSLWLQNNGWSTNDFSSIRAAFEKAMALDADRYDPAVGSWLEQSLHSVSALRKGGLCWDPEVEEDTPALLLGIRNLFHRATRLDPAKRISPEEFLEEINRLIRTTSQTQGISDVLYLKKTPVSVFLFDENLLSKYTGRYIAAAQEAMDLEESAYGNVPIKALCYSFRDWMPGEAVQQDLRSLVDYHGLCTAPNLKELIKDIPSRAGADTVNRLAVALYDAYCHLKTNEARESFTGAIHLFSPVAPLLREVGAVQLSGTDLTVDLLLGKGGLGALAERIVTITVHCPEDAPPSGEDWYAVEPLKSPLAANRRKNKSAPPPYPPVRRKQMHADGGYYVFGRGMEKKYL